MNLTDLSSKWMLLGGNETKSIKTIRLDPLSKPDLYLGLKTNQDRCLVLKLPQSFKADFQSSVKQNLSLELYSETSWVILTLLDDQFTDLFDDLLFSIYHKVFEITEPKSYVGEFLTTFYKWSEFFQDNQSDGLSDDEVRGLLGELLFLQNRLESVSSGQTNEILHSWTGPYDTGHDFTGEFSNHEVKTRLQTSASIKINGEYQLQAEPGKSLELIIITIKPDAGGLNLTAAVQQIRGDVIKAMGDYTIFMKTIGRKGLNYQNIELYSHLRFTPVTLNSYKVSDTNFPRLNRETLADAINGVSYRLTVEMLTPWITNEITF